VGGLARQMKTTPMIIVVIALVGSSGALLKDGAALSRAACHWSTMMRWKREVGVGEKGQCVMMRLQPGLISVARHYRSNQAVFSGRRGHGDVYDSPC
jgi:hypothetical protein